MPQIDFVAEDVPFKIPKPSETRAWIRRIVTLEKKQLIQLTYVFCSDDYLLSLNKQYLNHRTLTDIITFDHSENEGEVEGDIFVSIERVRQNAATFSSGVDEELHRVLVHGVLHLVGYSDKTSLEKKEMRKKEDQYLSLRRK